MIGSEGTVRPKETGKEKTLENTMDLSGSPIQRWIEEEAMSTWTIGQLDNGTMGTMGQVHNWTNGIRCSLV